MDVVTKLINLISAHALSKQKFKELLGNMDSMPVSLLMYNNVRWLSQERFCNNLLNAWMKL